VGAVPPLVGVAVNVTDVPAQIVLLVALIITDGTRAGLTAIGIALEVAEAGETQAALEVRITVTTSLLFKVVVVNVVALVPAFTPFTCHW
jgi:hypothetical protein